MTKIVLTLAVELQNKQANWGWVGGCIEDVVYLTSLACPTDIGIQLVKNCYSCSR